MRTLRILLALAGLAVTGFGLAGLLTDRYVQHPLDVLIWGVGGVLINDGLWLPVLCLVGAGLARSVPVRTGLIVAASITVVALPAVLRAGVDRENPTVLPLPYLRNLLVVLTVIAVAMAGWALLHRLRKRR